MTLKSRLRNIFRSVTLMTLLAFGVGHFSPIEAQVYDQEYTVKFINDHLESACRVYAEKKNVRIEYVVHGETVRIDYLFPETIDYENISYSESEGAVVVDCYEKAGKCIERDVIKRGSKILYPRSNLASTCTGETCNSLVTAMQHLILLYTDKGHERTEPF